MSEPIDLNAIRARVEAATPGPWWQGMVGDRLINEVDNAAAFGFVVVTAKYSDDGAGGVADAALIANAPTDVAALLDEVERLRTALAEAGEFMGPVSRARWIAALRAREALGTTGNEGDE